ncbi:MAG: class I SAM-dependent methyltransferase [Candidatus Thorarchaeota archaeon]|jgi:SAM-dependent methyltransferase
MCLNHSTSDEDAENGSYTYTNHYYYDVLPDYIFSENGKILEVGCGDGASQIASRHAERFQNSDYLGLDLRTDIKPKLNVIEANVLDYETQQTFDTVLAIAVVEHIPFSAWPKLFEKLKNMVRPGGYLAVLVPHDERLSNYIDSVDYHHCLTQYPEGDLGVPCHVVHGITGHVMSHFLPSARNIELRRRIRFRDEGESRVKAVFRFIRRFFTGHSYVWDGLKRKKYVLLSIWKKIES